MEGGIILFDGVCNFCNGIVNFVIRQDRKKTLRFAPFQSEAGQQLLKSAQLPLQDFRSVIFFHKGKIYKRSGAALKILDALPWYWKWTQLFWIVPAFLRDALYDFVAKHRYRWFGIKDACMIPTPDLRSRFLS